MERTEFLRQPVPVDRSWAKWVGGGLVLLSVCGFVWRVSERSDPIVVVNPAAPSAQTTATSGVGLVSNPFKGVGHPVSNLAAAIISSYDQAGRTVVVATSSGDLSLGAGRVEDLAGQMWAMGQTDPCDVFVTSPDPRQSPKAVKKVAGQPLPTGATPLFDCTPPTTVAGASTPIVPKAGE